MTIETPDRLDLHREGQESRALTLVASKDAVHAAEDVVVKLWGALSAPDRESARPVRDAVKILLIVHVSQDPGRQHWLTESVRGLLEPRIAKKAEHWWRDVLDVTVLKVDEGQQDETEYLLASTTNSDRLMRSRKSVIEGRIQYRGLDEGVA